MGQPNTVLADWQWFEDDVGHTQIENAHTNLSSPDSYLDTTIGLRVLLDNTGDKVETDGYKIRYRVDAGSWVDVTTSSSYVRAVTSSQHSDGDSTSQVLGGGTFDEGYWDTNGGVASYTLTNGQESENEHILQFRSADCGGHTVEVSIFFDDNGSLDGYTYSDPSCTFADGRIQQSHYRVRNDSYGLNVDNGWLDSEDTATDADVESLVRIRFGLEELDGLSKTITPKFQYQKNGTGGWTDLAVEADPVQSTTRPAVFITNSAQYADGDATNTALLSGSKTWVNATGEENNTVPSITLNNQRTELEVAVWMSALYDGPGQNDANDYFEFRVVESDNTLLEGSYVLARVDCTVPTGLIGGANVESWNRCLVCDANGNLYYLGEYATSENGVAMFKSTDGGDTWTEMDGAGRPSQVDLESADIAQEGDTLHVLVQGNTDVYYHRFYTSDHATLADTWDNTIVDEAVATSLTVNDQTAAIEYRDNTSPSTLVAFYQHAGSGNERIYYKIRSTGGSWGSENNLDSEASKDVTWVTVVKGASNLIHIAYLVNTDGYAYHRSLNTSDTLSGRELVHNDCGTGTSDQKKLPVPVYFDDGGDEKIMIFVHDESDSYLYSSIVTNDGTPASVVQATSNTVNYNTGNQSLQVPAATGANGTSVYLVYGALSDGDIYLAEYTGGSWQGSDVKQQTATAEADSIMGAVFTHNSGNGGNVVIGYVWTDDDDGGNGKIWYDERTIEILTSLDALAVQASLPSITVSNVAGGPNVNLNTISFLASALSFTVSPGAASTSLNLLSPQLAPQQLTVTPGAISTALNLLSPQLSAESLTVSPGAVSTALDLLATQVDSVNSTLSPGAVSMALDLLSIIGQLPQLSVSGGAGIEGLGALLWGGITGGITGANIPLSLLGMQAATQSLTVTPGAASTALDLLSIIGQIPSISVTGGAVSIVPNTLAIQSNALTSSVTGGAVSTALDLLSIAASLPQSSISPGSVSVDLDTLALAIATQQLSVSIITQILINTINMQASGLSLSVSGGPVSVAMDNLTLQVATQALTVEVVTGVLLSLLAVGSQAKSLTVTPGAISTALNLLSATASAESITVTPGAASIALSLIASQLSAETSTITTGAVSTSLNTLLLQAGLPTISVSNISGQEVLLSLLALQALQPSLSVVPGSVSATMNALQLQTGLLQSSLAPGAISTALNLLPMVGQAEALSVVPGSVSVALNALSSAAQVGSANILVDIIVALNSLGILGQPQSTSIVVGSVSIPMDQIQVVTSTNDLFLGLFIVLSALGITSSTRDLVASNYEPILDVDLLDRLNNFLEIYSVLSGYVDTTVLSGYVDTIDRSRD